MGWQLLKLGDRYMGVHYSLKYPSTFVRVYHKTSFKEQRQNKNLSKQQRKIIKKQEEVTIIWVEDGDPIKRAWETIGVEWWWVEICTYWLWDAIPPHLNIHHKSVHLGKSISGSFKKNFKMKQANHFQHYHGELHPLCFLCRKVSVSLLPRFPGHKLVPYLGQLPQSCGDWNATQYLVPWTPSKKGGDLGRGTRKAFQSKQFTSPDREKLRLRESWSCPPNRAPSCYSHQ